MYICKIVFTPLFLRLLVQLLIPFSFHRGENKLSSDFYFHEVTMLQKAS